MSRACAIDWPQAIRQSDEFFVSVFFVPEVHHRLMFVRKPNVCEGAGNTLKPCGCQAEARVKIATVSEIMGSTSTGSCCPLCRTRRRSHCRSARRRPELEESEQQRLSHQIYL